MKIDLRIHQVVAFSIIFKIMVLAATLFTVSNNAFAQQLPPPDLNDQQTLHERRLSEVVKQSSVVGQHSQIDVGDLPLDIDILEGPDTAYIYIANSGSNTVSVINAENHEKIAEDILVERRPADIDIHRLRNTVYVANYDSNTVSVIPEGTISNIEELNAIPVGIRPAAIGVSPALDRVYVANSGSNTVSVINAENHEKIEDIPVGELPAAIAVNEGTDSVYVANYRSSGISVIDAVDNEIVAGTTFQEDPLDSGYIECDGLAFPSSPQQYYVPSGTECIARPNPGFEFVSWEENLEDGSTQLIRVSRPATAFESFLDLLNVRSDEPEAKLNITKFGTFTANFKELPPAVPSEYWIPLYGIIASTIVGWSIPSIIGWIKSKMDIRKLNHYHKQITSLYRDGKLDENDIEALDKLRQSIVNGYSTGNLSEKHYENLKDETSILYDKIFRKRLNEVLSDNNPTDEKATQEQLFQIRNDVEYAYSEGKVNEKHYVLLTKAISNLNSKNDDIP